MNLSLNSQKNDLESEMNAFYSKEALLYGGYLIQSDFTEKAITAQAILESALPIAGFGISKGIARFSPKAVRNVSGEMGEAGTVGAMKARNVKPLDDLVKLPDGSIVTQGGRKLTQGQIDELSKLDLSRWNQGSHDSIADTFLKHY
ncbi:MULTISPECIES: hypothetical protein [Paenibacillus]|uniref:hypothetical protein n=1 Tax=Paenibacillus TaxID=44249 RepID=UPI002FE3D029